MVGLRNKDRRLALAAAAWAFLFAAINLNWGLGGTFGIETLGDGLAAMARRGEPELLFINWISVAGKILIGMLALALMRPWRYVWMRRLVYIGALLAGILLTFYGIGNLIQHTMMLTGMLPVPGLLGSIEAVRWHLFLWDPVWLLGGILFLLAVRVHRQLNQTEA